MSDAAQVTPFKYRAFISYSHADKDWGDWLHKALESYRIPSKLVGMLTASAGPVPKRLYPVFRDREELPTSADLGGQIRAALEASQFLIVIASPRSATSHWVNEEVLTFKRLGREALVLPIIVDGEPNAASRPGFDPDTECFCPALKFALGADGELSATPFEPICADARPQGDGKDNALLKLVAGLLNVGFDALKQRDAEAQRRRALQRGIFAGLALTVLAGGGTALWMQQRNAAVDRSLALAELARKASDAHRPDAAARYAVAGLSSLGTDAPDAIAELRRAMSAPNPVYAKRIAGRSLTAVLSNDGQKLFIGEKGGLAIVDPASGREIIRLDGDPAPIAHAAFSPDGTRLVTASTDDAIENKGTLIVWDTATGKEIARRTGSLVYGLRFMPDGKRVLSWGDSAIVWEAETGADIFALHTEGTPCGTSVDLSPDGTRLVATCFQFGGHVFDAATGAQTQRLADGPSRSRFAFSPDGKSILATDTYGMEFGVFDPITGNMFGSLALTSQIISVAWRPDSGQFALGFNNGLIHIYNVAGGQPVMLQGRDFVTALTYAPAGDRILAGYADGFAQVFDTGSGQTIATLSGEGLNARLASYTHDKKHILTVSDQGVRLWPAEIGPASATWTSADGEGIAISADARRVALGGGGSHPAQLFDASTGALLTAFNGGAQALDRAGFSPDALRLVTASYDTTTWIWDTATGAKLTQLKLDPPAQSAISGAGFTPDGAKLVAIEDDGDVHVQDAAAGKTLSHFSTPKTSQYAAPIFALSPDGARIALGYWLEKTVGIYDLATGQTIASFAAPGVRSLLDVAFAPDGARVAISWGETVAIHDAATGAQTGTFAFPERDAGQVAYAPNGRWLYVHDREMLHAFDVATGRLVGRFDGGKAGNGVQLAVSLDGTRLAAASDHLYPPIAVRVTTLPDSLRAEAGALQAKVCAGALAHGQSLFTADDLASAPFLDPVLDRDPCDPPSFWMRQAYALGVESWTTGYYVHDPRSAE